MNTSDEVLKYLQDALFRSPEEIHRIGYEANRKCSSMPFIKYGLAAKHGGHNDTDPQNKSDPGFPIPDFVRSNFGKINASPSGTTPPLTPEEIAAQRREGG